MEGVADRQARTAVVAGERSAGPCRRVVEAGAEEGVARHLVEEAEVEAGEEEEERENHQIQEGAAGAVEEGEEGAGVNHHLILQAMLRGVEKRASLHQ